MRVKRGKSFAVASIPRHKSRETIVWGVNKIFFSFLGLSNIEDLSTSNSVGVADEVHHQSQRSLDKKHAAIDKATLRVGRIPPFYFLVIS